MSHSVQETVANIRRASSAGWEQFRAELEQKANREIVNVDWDVIYDPLGHDIIVHGFTKAAEPDVYLLQVWAKDQHPGIWIPEYRPWVASVVEFEATQQVTKAKFGVVDSKWRTEDSGEGYLALVWGYVDHRGSVTQFGPFEKEFTYP